MHPKILLVDDDKQFINDLTVLLENDYSVIFAQNEKDALHKLEEESPDVVLLDLMFNDRVNGLDILRKMLSKDLNLPVIMMTDYASVETAIEAIKIGAFDYISKTPNMKELNLLIKRSLQNKLNFLQQSELKNEIEKKYKKIVGESEAIIATKEKIALFAENDRPVLISGESGVGKELVARQIHFKSVREDKPFIAVNCAALPKDLIESELFGYEKGAFTGAVKRKPGKFELAAGGTIFLDEIAELSPETQVKLLRVLQEKEFERVGGIKSIKAKCRIISATNRNLTDLVKEGKFREDLFYRLDVLPVVVPPLRERKEDIPLLIKHFTEEIAKDLHLPVKEFPQKLIADFMNYSWPGNVRELQNYVTRFMIVPENDNVLPLGVSKSDNYGGMLTIPKTWAEMDRLRKEEADNASRRVEKIFLEDLLKRNKGNITKAAEEIGINRSNLHKMMKKCGM